VLGDKVAQEPVLMAPGEYPSRARGLALAVTVDGVLLGTDLFTELPAVDVVTNPEDTATLGRSNTPLCFTSRRFAMCCSPCAAQEWRPVLRRIRDFTLRHGAAAAAGGTLPLRGVPADGVQAGDQRGALSWPFPTAPVVQRGMRCGVPART